MSLAEPIVLRIGEGVYAINEFGLDTAFLVEGEREALLIDTGMGLASLRGIAEGLTMRPIRVALTHGHLDHCGGWDEFDEVWLHPADKDAALAVTCEARAASSERMRGLEGDPDVWDYDSGAVREWKSIPRIRELSDGAVFDLGGRSVSTVWTPGHSPGSCCFIDDKSRILFSGDACNVSLMVTDCPVETALEGLLRLSEHRVEFDRNFNGHLGYSSGLTHISMPESALDDCILAFRRILDGRAEPHTSFRSHWGDRPEVRSYICGAVTVTYRPDRLWKEAER